MLGPVEVDLQIPPFQLVLPDLVPVGSGVGALGSELQERLLDLGAGAEQRAEEIAVEVEAAGDADVIEQCGGCRGTP